MSDASLAACAARRKKFLQQLDGAVAVLPSAPEVLRNPDVKFPYRQESNFYYLTGFEEPHSIALFAEKSDHPFQLFVPPKDRTKELWEGHIEGPAVAKKKYGADAASSSKEPEIFDAAFRKAISKAKALYYKVGLDQAMDQRIFRLMDQARKAEGRTGRGVWPIIDPKDILGEMRAIKDKTEIERLERAAEISAQAHCELMKQARPGMHEFELEALFVQFCRAQGAARLGYGSIVATGANACTLHYTSNDKKLKSGDLVLIDAGAEYEYYTADITRCFPANGKFTEAQKKVYEAVYRTQVACVKAVKPGKNMKALQAFATEKLTEELVGLKVLKGNKKELLKKEKARDYYPHGLGHWLGLDVHDVGRYYFKDLEDPRPLQAGMLLTIEPGLYFQKYNPAPAGLKGIGVRIEDDVLVTKTGNKVLTAGVPKEWQAIEAMCQSGR